MIAHKVKYVETKPIAREIIFENRQLFWDFFDEYYTKEILDKLCYNPLLKTFDFSKIDEVYEYHTILLKKDGTYCKPHSAPVMNEEWKKNQKEGWKKWLDKQREIRNADKELIEIIPLLIKNKIYRAELEKLINKFKTFQNGLQG